MDISARMMAPLGYAGLLLLTLAGSPGHAGIHEIPVTPDIQQQVGDRDVIFFATDLERGVQFAYQPSRVDERHIPYSTFKIPNLVIALETGVATSLAHERDWDATRRPAHSFWPADWKQRQTLESAFKRSAVWYFQDMALEVGGARYRQYLKAFGYGNADVPDHDDMFWLKGPLAISPKEQTMFLTRLVSQDLHLRPQTWQALQQASLLADIAGHRIHGKTGSGPLVATDFSGPFEGWQVGWVDRPADAPVVYALYVAGSSYDAIARFRGQAVIMFLQTIGIVPQD